ncbi:hypothetical protein PG987_006279 [Apiospora arundinis]
MDRLSIILPIAGFSQAGTALSNAASNLMPATRNASREVYDIVRPMGDFSLVLGELQRVLHDGKESSNGDQFGAPSRGCDRSGNYVAKCKISYISPRAQHV